MSDIVDIHNIGSKIRAAIGSAFTSVTAGGAGNGTPVVGATIDRLDPNTGSLAASAQLDIFWSATLTATKTLSLAGLKVEQSADGTNWAATSYLSFPDPGVVDSGTGSGSGVYSVSADLNAAMRYVRFDWTPTLSNTATDTATLLGAAILAGYDRLAA